MEMEFVDRLPIAAATCLEVAEAIAFVNVGEAAEEMVRDGRLPPDGCDVSRRVDGVQVQVAQQVVALREAGRILEWFAKKGRAVQ